jgi:YggT family protein
MPNTGTIDFSPLVLILLLQILTRVLMGVAGAY